MSKIFEILLCLCLYFPQLLYPQKKILEAPHKEMEAQRLYHKPQTEIPENPSLKATSSHNPESSEEQEQLKKSKTLKKSPALFKKTTESEPNDKKTKSNTEMPSLDRQHTKDVAIKLDTSLTPNIQEMAIAATKVSLQNESSNLLKNAHPDEKAEAKQKLSESTELLKKTISEQLSDSENNVALTSKINNALSEMNKIIKTGEVVDVEKDSDVETEAKAYNPDAERMQRISEGTRIVSSLVKNPETIAAEFQRPAILDKLFDPSAKIKPKELKTMRNDPDVKQYLDRYNSAIQTIGEHFFNEAKKQDPKLSSGTIVIEDKDDNLHKFMQTYVHTISKLNNGTSTDPDKPCFLANGKGYARISSHFDDYHKYGSKAEAAAGKPTQYGIDLDTPIQTFTHNATPDDTRSHMLFGKVDSDKKTIFIKFETHGLGGAKEAALHGVNYIRSVGRKFMDSGKDKSSANEPVETAKYKIADRRENAPKPILHDYKKLLKADNIGFFQRRALAKEAKARGISRMIARIEKFQKKASPERADEMANFINKIKNTYGNENLDLRVGNEIIFRNTDN